MTFKRNRTQLEKILDCLDDKIQNIHPDLREKLIGELLENPISNNVAKCKSYVAKILKISNGGKHSKDYWLSRGWSLAEAHIRSKQHVKRGNLSPYSREFWICKMNPKTGKHYTIDEADYERNSRRPIRKEYWIGKGYSTGEAEILALRVKKSNDKNGANKSKSLGKEIHRISSKRCTEYWISRGYTEEQAKQEVAKRQATFTLEKCIEKYGEEAGRQRWLNRQEKWHKSFKKSNFSKVSQELFWAVAEQLESLDSVYFAELSPDKTPDYSGVNHELRLKLEKVILPDFADTHKKRIIEFNGIYWHGDDKEEVKERMERKLQIYEDNGYEVLSICESEYRNDKNATVEKCLNFLRM